MPELPEVEMVVRMLRPQLVGRRIEGVELLWERIVDRPTPEEFSRQLTGATLTTAGRRGKYLLFPLDNGQTWLVHLRMTGKFLVRSDPGLEAPADALWNPTHIRARLRLDNGTYLLYIDMRKFGRFYLVSDPEEIVGDLGPEPLGEEFTGAWLQAALEGRRGELKRLLLQQHFLVGLGNIYVNEALWRAGIHPQRIAGTLTPTEIARLHTAIVTALREGIQNGGTSLGDRQYVYPDGNLGQHQHHLAVYDREESRCPRCGYAIERIIQGQRSTYFCPVCQAAPRQESSE
ncbi:MAG TPA: bifunctional DNA-formamidopyrimidine glycosylase/DNA-(apurinic or apyrimidinic site) lyase [Thermoflexia bacterium]|nr:bifunctional DNA-formamidopyrimidine glycosylase/DNA-(apurinic or apyrimidinic site) lyase [Thermoflexia bacterium]